MELPHYIDAPTEPLDAENLERIHATSLRVLEEIGVEFLNDEALDYFKKAGCKIKGRMCG